MQSQPIQLAPWTTRIIAPENFRVVRTFAKTKSERAPDKSTNAADQDPHGWLAVCLERGGRTCKREQLHPMVLPSAAAIFNHHT